MFHVKHPDRMRYHPARRFHVKHLDSGHRSLFAALLEECCLSIPPELQTQLLLHLDWVLEQNRTINLTAIREPGEAVRLHTLDSLLALPEVLQAQAGLMVDIGTGGGFPGLPLALASGRDTLLLDSVGKKARALQGFIAEVQSPCSLQALAIRAEDLARESPGKATVVVARAVAALPSLVELASPLLGEGGVLVAMKGRLESPEVESADRVGKMTGMRRVGIREYALPLGGEQRSVAVYARRGQPTVRLPRRVGMAQSKPLA